jgi:hypothetical protein
VCEGVFDSLPASQYLVFRDVFETDWTSRYDDPNNERPSFIYGYTNGSHAIWKSCETRNLRCSYLGMH